MSGEMQSIRVSGSWRLKDLVTWAVLAIVGGGSLLKMPFEAAEKEETKAAVTKASTEVAEASKADAEQLRRIEERLKVVEGRYARLAEKTDQVLILLAATSGPALASPKGRQAVRSARETLKSGGDLVEDLSEPGLP
jgi:hypothetical protein